MKKVVRERKDISFYIKMFPLKIHAGAYDKAKAIVCEKSLALLESAFEEKSLPAPKCKTTAVDDNIKLAGKFGITSAPLWLCRTAGSFPDLGTPMHSRS